MVRSTKTIRGTDSLQESVEDCRKIIQICDGLYLYGITYESTEQTGSLKLTTDINTASEYSLEKFPTWNANMELIGNFSTLDRVLEELHKHSYLTTVIKDLDIKSMFKNAKK